MCFNVFISGSLVVLNKIHFILNKRGLSKKLLIVSMVRLLKKKEQSYLLVNRTLLTAKTQRQLCLFGDQ